MIEAGAGLQVVDRDAYVQRTSLMGTVVTIIVVRTSDAEPPKGVEQPAVERALDWFRQVEATCSRFDADSELSHLCAPERVGTPVTVSVLLLEATRFALALAEETRGAFDPTVGHRMEAEGFNVEYRTGQQRRTFDDRPPVQPSSSPPGYRHIRIDPATRTITLMQPLLLDLGAVAKGLAVDLAARELGEFDHFAIDAGGDVYVRGGTREDASWRVGIRHPRDATQLIETLAVTDAAVCTSGDYERRNAAGLHHMLDPRTGASADACASVTVIAPTAMVADGLSTAAFVLGPRDGLSLLEANGAQGLIVTPALERMETPGFRALVARTIAADGIAAR